MLHCTACECARRPCSFPETYLNSSVLPVVVSVIVSYAIAEIFFAVYEMAVDTLLLAYCDDSDAHGGTPKHAPALLLEALATVQLPQMDPPPAAVPAAQPAA